MCGAGTGTGVDGEMEGDGLGVGEGDVVEVVGVGEGDGDLGTDGGADVVATGGRPVGELGEVTVSISGTTAGFGLIR